ncbi:MAG: hypothetical protein ACRD88_01045 [Terriglobia bacterium]
MDYRKEGATTSLADFSQFCNDQFHLRQKAKRLPEFRKDPDIPMSTLFLFLVGGLALHRKSFHQMDLFGRQKEVRQWLGTSRYLVASDATFWRVLPGMDQDQIREELQQACVLLRQKGHGKIELPEGRMLRAAAIDGTVLSGRYASVLEVLGAHAAVADLEPCENKGKELPASAVLLRRFFQRHPGSIDVVLGDGLYITQDMIRLCREELSTHLLVKGSEETLVIVRNAEEIIESRSRPIEETRGVDLLRGVAFEIQAVSGLRHMDVPHPLKVARVKLDRIKGSNRNSCEDFWIITTDQSLTPLQMRELAHLRWSIENHAFRALSAAVDSKHVWTRGPNSDRRFEVLMLLMFLAFTLLLAYHAQLDQDVLWKLFRLRKMTLAHLVECFILSLQSAAGAFAPG